MVSFEDNPAPIGHTGYFLSKVEIKDFSVITDGQNLFDQLVKNHIKNIKTLGKLIQFSEVTTQLAAFRIIHTSKKTTV